MRRFLTTFAVMLALCANAWSATITVGTVADLATARPGDGDIVSTLGYTTVGVGANTYRYDADSAATANGGTIIAGPGSVGRYIAIDQTRIDVTQFGADPTGVADSTDEIQDTIDAALATSTQDSPTVVAAGQSPEVYIPAGVYKISSQLTVGSNSVGYYSAITISGDGPTKSVLRAATATTSATMPFMISFDNVTDEDANNHWTIDGISLEGTNPWNDGDSVSGIDMMKSAYATVRNCRLRYFDKAIEIRNWSNLIETNRFEYCTTGIYVSEADGIDGQTTINDLIFTRNSFGTVDYCIHTARSLPINYLKITDSQFDGASRAAILFNGPIAQFQIQNNYFELQGTTGTATIATNDSGGTATCNGAIVMHPTTNNTSGANGTISGNLFINCNLTSIISSSGNKTLTITDNAIESSSTVATFVDFTDASGITSGPLPYSASGRVYVEGSRKNSAGTEVATRLVTTANADTDGTSCIVVRDRSGYSARGFCLNDPADLTDISGSYTGTLVKSRSPDGCVMFTHNSGTGTLGKEISLTVDANSPLSGAMLRITGMVMCDDGTGALSAYMMWDASGTPVSTEHLIGASFTPGVWGKSWNITYQVPVVTSGTKVLRIRLYRTTGIPGGTNTYLKNFAICAASAELGEENVLLID